MSERGDQISRHFERQTWDDEYFGVAQATMKELKWRHSHWWDTRQKILELLATGLLGRNHYERFANCGAMATVQWSTALRKHRVSAILCKSRHCDPCMRQKAGRIAGNLKDKMRSCPPGSFRFITLTLRHDQATKLEDQLKRLIKHFRTLRAQKLWKRTQKGGAFTIEVKLTSTGWHAHLHVISQGSWMDGTQLRDLWNRVTGDSFQADIRRIPDADALAGYVVKYVTKSTTPNVWEQPAFAAEYLKGVKGMRTCATLGTWRGMKLTEPRPKTEDWQHVAALEDVIREAGDQQPWATAVILSLRPPHDNTEHKETRKLKRAPTQPRTVPHT